MHGTTATLIEAEQQMDARHPRVPVPELDPSASYCEARLGKQWFNGTLICERAGIVVRLNGPFTKEQLIDVVQHLVVL